MNALVLANGVEFKYTNAFFTRESNTLDFEFAPETDYIEVFNAFSELGENFDVENLNQLTLKDLEGNLLGVWEGFNSLINIENKIQFLYGEMGEKTSKNIIRITLLKETVSEEFKRIKDTEINSLKEMNLMLMMALAETVETQVDMQQSTEIALAELVEILSERGVI